VQFDLLFHEVILPLAVAVILGGLVGLERMRKDRPAGFRTYMLVSLGAASFVLIATRLYAATQGSGPGGPDPIRMIDGVATGIGFLGAGSIVRSGGDVRGVTTAAGIWAVGALGAACGLRYYDLALTLTPLMLLVLYPLGILQDWMERRAGFSKES
jgi:putative Mg2+ transporter-C (MgtC) family protein